MLEIYLVGMLVWIFQEFNHNWLDRNPSRDDIIWGGGCAVFWPLAVLFLGTAMLGLIIDRAKERWNG